MKVRFTIENKMYIFVTAVVLLVAIGVAALSFMINSTQMERFYKRITSDSAKNYASLADVEYLKEFKAVVMTDEYRQLRDEAEQNDDEEPVISYFKEKGVWDQYVTERNKLRSYMDNIADIKYLYIVLWGDKDSKYNMYLIDGDDVPVYEVGLYEEREEEFLGVDASDEIEPTISDGNWGWLCSAYAPVYDSGGELVCTVGCDLDMEDVIRDRKIFLMYIMITSLILIAVILTGAVFFVNRTVIRPLTRLTEGLKHFDPEDGKGYDEAGVIKVDVRSNDEIRDIYEETRSMQIRIIDHINSIIKITKEKEMAEHVVRTQKKEIGVISRKAYRDSLTGVGNKEAYSDKMEQLNEDIRRGDAEFAILMLDINMLKTINDTYGHTKGDIYIKGCCMILCESFKHSHVYRIGGDEFVAVLTGNDYNDRFEKLEEMKKRFAKTEKDKNADHWHRYSASVGISEFKEGDTDSETVFRRADELMYEHKEEHKKGR